MSMTRRDFMAGVAALAGLSAGLKGAGAFAQPSRGGPAIVTEQVLRSTCVHCVNFCGIEVRKLGEAIRGIAPDARRRDFYNHGICPKGVAGGFNVHNPYRIKRPLRRTNPAKGLDQDPQWIEIT